MVGPSEEGLSRRLKQFVSSLPPDHSAQTQTDTFVL